MNDNFLRPKAGNTSHVLNSETWMNQLLSPVSVTGSVPEVSHGLSPQQALHAVLL